jgi:CBS domain containing-hemolysin-like protein
VDPVPWLWVAAAVLSWWIGAFAAGVRYELVRLEAGEEPGEGYELVSLLRRLRDDPVSLALRLRFSRFLAAAFVPLTLAAAVAHLTWELTVAVFAAGWLAPAAADAAGGGRLIRRVGRLRGGLIYGLWARLTLPVVRLTAPLLRLRTEPLEEAAERTLVLAESQAALTASRGRLGREERRLLRGLLASGSIQVGDIMTPWEGVRRLDARISLPEAVRAVHDSGHSRLPVLEDGKVVGLVTAKDLLGRSGQEPGGLGGLLRLPYFVNLELTGRDLLEELQAARVHLAVVVDLLGRLVGIVTMEDLLEEIVGELHDEREREES